uniref:Uncharacterized protein n=1 Tax=viral metagenome TaxID=1070528 RepID=A0A6C0BG07_9ZZZZ
MSVYFESAYCAGTINYDNDIDRQISVKGRINENIKDNKLYFVAASPPDYRATFTGSGLPFHSQIQAFQNTPNKGSIDINGYGEEFEIKLIMPNSYYVGLGTVVVPPTLYLEYVNQFDVKRNISVKLSYGIPYRSLTWPGPGQNTAPRANVMFYGTQFNLPVRSQEQILRDSCYPVQNKMDSDFWGLKPPL